MQLLLGQCFQLPGRIKCIHIQGRLGKWLLFHILQLHFPLGPTHHLLLWPNLVQAIIPTIVLLFAVPELKAELQSTKNEIHPVQDIPLDRLQVISVKYHILQQWKDARPLAVDKSIIYFFFLTLNQAHQFIFNKIKKQLLLWTQKGNKLSWNSRIETFCCWWVDD